ncbi:acyl-CoA dehydrogenase family protein [Algivirga pacifica]|uniref:Acyl-[acyl-carrier-protein] dehydrogenase MbtN n=1 Tax=Algivirga pacifica TaxID=1162670 RepID=A0ABP9DA85_9BACT
MLLPNKPLSDEHRFFLESIREFYQTEIVPHHEEWEQQGMISREAWTKAGELGFLCLTVPEEYGGAGVDFSFSQIMIEEQHRQGCSGPGFYLHSDIVAPYLVHQGSDYLKYHFLPKMATGECITAIGMTEPGAGSDLQAIRTTAIRDGDEYIINGSKTFITNGYMCDAVLLAVKTDPNNENRSAGTSLIMVEADREGFTKNYPFKKIGMKAQDTCEMFFDDVRVPVKNLLGEEGKGFLYMMQELPRERLLVAINAIAVAEEALKRTIQYVQERQAFGKQVAQFQNTRFKIAEMTAEVQMGRLLVDRCCELLSNDQLDAETAAMAKFATTDIQCKVVDECLQLHGGYGYMWEFWIAKAYADSRVQKIYAGTNEIMKEIVAKKVIKENQVVY